MRTRKYKYELSQKVYDLYRDLNNAPFNKDGTRFRGSHMSVCYWNGRDNGRNWGDVGSQSYAAYYAGKDIQTDLTILVNT